MAGCQAEGQPLPEPAMTQFTDAYMYHQATV